MDHHLDGSHDFYSVYTGHEIATNIALSLEFSRRFWNAFLRYGMHRILLLTYVVIYTTRSWSTERFSKRLRMENMANIKVYTKKRLLYFVS